MRACFTTGCSVVALALVSPRALADDVDSLESALSQTVVTTASTEAESASSAPATSSTLTAEEMRVYGIRSLDEAIQFLSVGLVVSKPLRTPDLGARGVLLPGDDGKHFLLLVDGHSVNDPLYGAARFDQGAGIPIDLIDRIEVIVGPGSVLYGSNAMLGVINVITKLEKDYRGGHVFGEYELERSARAGAGAGFHFDLFGERAEVTAAVEYFRRFGPALDFELQPPVISAVNGETPRYRRGGAADGIWGGTVSDAYFAEAPMGSLRLRVADFDLSLFASAYRRGIPYTNGLVDVDFDDEESYELDRALRLDLKHYAAPSAFLQLTSRVYADGFDYQRRVNRDALQGCVRSGFETCQYYTAGRARWAGIEERVSLNWLKDSSLVTLIGLDARMRWVSAKEDALDFATGQAFTSSTGVVDDSAGLVSPYVQQTYRPNLWLDLNFGARLDVEERISPIVSPRGAVAIRPFELTTTKVVYSQAFRAPTWNETDVGTIRQARAGELEPEVVRSIEASIEQRVATQRLMFGVYRTWWENLVEPRTLTNEERGELQRRGELPISAVNVVQYRNVASLDNYGYNGSWDGTLAEGRLRYGMNATAAFVRRDSAQGLQPLPAAPAFFGNARISYAAGGYAPIPALAVSYMHDRLVDRPYVTGWSETPTAAPVAEFRATLSGPIPGVAGLAYRLSGTYATASRSAYTAGNLPEIITNVTEPSLAPIDRYSAFLGLRYDFATGETFSHGDAP
jgi:outer membrane receptor for ferrienterochelin and colicins